MKLSMMISYSGDFLTDVQKVVDLEKAGLDVVWVPEAYSFDAVSQMGYLAAKTSTIEIGSGILNVFSRTASCVGQTAAGLDLVSNGRFILGLGASGPQVIEGFHGVPYAKPMPRVRDYINVCRQMVRREKIVYEGSTISVPLPEGEGTGLGKPLKLINHPVRSTVPIYWASLMGLSVANTAQHADGWMPFLFDPQKYRSVWGDYLDKGLAKRDPELGELKISAGGMVAIGEDLVGEKRDAILDRARPQVALYVGGMGARGKNFYNTIVQRYGYEKEAAAIQDAYLAGKKDEAAALIPRELLEQTNLVGPSGYIDERLGQYRTAGVTDLSVSPVGANAVETVETLKELLS